MKTNHTHSFMPAWGPYSKKYMGISKIPENRKNTGARFDLSVFPGTANSGNPPLNVTFPTGYHPWEASEDLTYFSYRVDIQWKDVVYADVSFSAIDRDSYLIRTEFVNHSALSQICLLNLFASMEYPSPSYCKLNHPEKYVWIDALEYEQLAYARPRPWDRLNPDGKRKGEVRDACSTGGSCLGDSVSCEHVPHLAFKPFGSEAGDMVSYCFTAPAHFAKPMLALRYRSCENAQTVFHIALNGEGYRQELPFHREMEQIFIPLSAVAEKNSLKLTSLGGAGVEIDYFAVIEQEDMSKLTAVQIKQAYVPTVQFENNQLSYRYSGMDEMFYLYTTYPQVRHRSIETGTLEDALVSRLSNADATFDEVTRTFTDSFRQKKSDEGFFHNSILHSFHVPAGEQRVLYAVVSNKEITPCTEDRYEVIYQQRRACRVLQNVTPAGEQFELSNRLLRSALLCNVVYPIYRHGSYVVHHTPGKRWDSLYTWDSGFIGLGLLEINQALPEYILDMYLSEAENQNFAFLHHGSPVPVQFYLFAELLKKSKEPEVLKKYYQPLRRYYLFLAGKAEGSTTNPFQSGLLTTYDYFYNSSGMDDLPPQVAMHKNGLEPFAAPCISTSHVIRCAKILAYAAHFFGMQADVSEYEEDITFFTGALQHAWDAESGYFSYVIHDETGYPVSFLRTPEGENFNKGMDGVYPLIAGACTEEQENSLLAHIQNPAEMLTEVGISAVDRTASYYIGNGYWNGNVWFSHQWFLWKTMLDLGEGAFAWEMAQIALQAWKKEVDATYNTFEMLNIETGRGGWYHQFGGLSAPLNIWHSAYYLPGTVSTGLDTWVQSCEFTENESAAGIAVKKCTEKSSLIIVAMNPAYDYTVHINGEEAAAVCRTAGALEILLETDTAVLKIRKREALSSEAIS